MGASARWRRSGFRFGERHHERSPKHQSLRESLGASTTLVLGPPSARTGQAERTFSYNSRDEVPGHCTRPFSTERFALEGTARAGYSAHPGHSSLAVVRPLDADADVDVAAAEIDERPVHTELVVDVRDAAIVHVSALAAAG
jgi:hypothetical protein